MILVSLILVRVDFELICCLLDYKNSYFSIFFSQFHSLPDFSFYVQLVLGF